MKKIILVAFLWIGTLLNLFSQPIFLKEIPESSNSFFEGDGKLYFFAGDSLWKSDGTTAGTAFVKKLGETPIGFCANDYKTLSIAGSSIFFTQDSPATIGVWRTGGTSGTTIKIRSFNSISPMIAYQNNLYFAADDGISGGELWKLSSTFSFSLVKDINPGAASSLDTDLSYNDKILSKGGIISNNILYFGATNPSSGSDVWKTDGTGAGTAILKDLPHTSYALGDLNGTLFLATNYGTSDGTTLVKEFRLDGYIDGLSGGFVYKNQLAFFYNNEYSTALYFSDGTNAGTKNVYNYISSSYGGVAYSFVINDAIVVTQGYDSKVTFINRTDGTAEGSVRIGNYHDGYMNGTVEFVKVKEKLLYNDVTDIYDPESDGFDEIYETSGYPGKGTIRRLREIYPNGNSYPNSQGLTEVNGTLFFVNKPLGNYPPSGKFKLWNYNPDKPAANVPYFTLVNADTDKDIGYIRESDTLFKHVNSNINIRYNPTGSIGSVVLKVNDVTRRTESSAPYALAGDNAGDYSPWEGTTGQYKVTGVPYSGSGGTGTQGSATSVNFFLSEFKTNSRPIVNAGPDRTLTIPTGTVKIVGTHFDPDGDNLGVGWTYVSFTYCNPGSCPFYFDSNYDTLILNNLIPGEYIFKFYAYDQYLGSEDEVKITVLGQSVESFSLINADNDFIINSGITEGTTFDLAYLPSNINFAANVPLVTIGSVKFNYDGVIRTENVAPYAYFGDNNGDYNAGTLKLGSHTLSAWPYTGKNATGSQGQGSTVHFNVINSAARTGETEALQLKAYPNPSSDKFNISIPESADEDISVSVYNSQGLLVSKLYEGVYQKNEMIWDVNNIPEGIYFCKVNTSSGSRIEKLVVRK